MRGNKSLRDSQPASPSGSDDDNVSPQSPPSAAREVTMEDEKTPSRGGKGKADGADAMDVGA